MVEERFNTEYLIAIVVAIALVFVIALVSMTLVALKCRRGRRARRRKRSLAADSSQSSTCSNSVKGNEIIQKRMRVQQLDDYDHFESTDNAGQKRLLRTCTNGEAGSNETITTQVSAAADNKFILIQGYGQEQKAF